MSRIAQLRDLSVDDWKVLLPALFLLPWVALLLRAKGFSGAQKLIIPPGPDSALPVRAEQLERARRISRMVEVAAFHGFYRANCLKRSLMLAWILRRNDIPFELRIGTAREQVDGKEGAVFTAHAWVESGGVVLNDHVDINERFAPFENRINGSD